MSDDREKIPYRKGETPPGPGYMLGQTIDTNGNDEGMFWTPTKDARQSTIQHGELEALLPMLRWTWKHLREHIAWARSFEDWELGFLRNANPGSETTAWVRQTYAYLEFLHKNPNAGKAAVFGAIMALANGREDSIEPASVARKLKSLLSNPPSVLGDPANFTKDGRLKTKERHLR